MFGLRVLDGGFNQIYTMILMHVIGIGKSY